MQLFNDWSIDEILDCTEFDIFDSASVKNIIIILSKGTTDYKLGYRESNNTKSFQELISRPIVRIDKNKVKSNNQNWGLIFKLSADVLELVRKIKIGCFPLHAYFPETSQGLIAYDKYTGQSDEIIESRAFHSFTKKNDSYKPWLYGEDITRYSVKWNGAEYINYCDEVANPRKPKFFIGKRILVREITNPSIYAAYTNLELYNDPSIIVILNKTTKKDFTILTLLGILNSKFATFYHFNSSPKATKGAFPKILIYDINNFPLPINLKYDTLDYIHMKVEHIITSRKNDPNTDTSMVEKEIDELVYKIYGLTQEEITLIENKL